MSMPEVTEAPEMGVEIVATLSQKDLAAPGVIERVKALPKGNIDVVECGYVFGKVHALSIRSNRFSDEASVALVGIFEGVRIDGMRIRSTACFLPRQIHGTIVEAVRGDAKLPQEVAPKQGQRLPNVTGLNEISFVIALAIRHDDTEVGYRWLCRQIGDDSFAQNDPFAALRHLVRGSAPSAIAGPIPAGIAPSRSTRAAMAVPAKALPPAEKPAGKPRKVKEEANRAYGKVGGKGRAA